MKKHSLLIFRLCSLIIALFSLSYRLLYNPLDGHGLEYRFYQLGFFSIQSSLFIAVIFMFLLINQIRGNSDEKVTPSFRGAALLYGIVTMVMFFSFFIGTFNLHGINSIVLFINHVILAVLLAIDNIITIKPQTYKWDLLLYWMIYPFYYLVFTFIEGFILGKNRYYFLIFDKMNSSFYPFALLLMAFIFIITGVLIIFVNKIYKRRLEPEVDFNLQNNPENT